jgi:glycosidase
MRTLYVSIIAVALLAGSAIGVAGQTAGEPEPITPVTAETAGLEWWNDRVFYEVFVRSFKDSDGDGIGDLAGLTASLDYLNDGDPTTTDDLGITGIWLMPINASPSYHGYDVVDYRSVNPDYGTMEDFEAFLEAAHDRGIAVLMDFVINHSGRDHPWFQASAAGDPKYADWYLWSDTDPASVGPWGQQVWHERDGRYYFGLFWEGMPDLNLENPEVTAELRDIADYWLNEVGVDGFRLDAARHLIEDGEVMTDTAASVEWLEGFNAYVDETAADALVLGEVWSSTLDVASYVPGGLDLAFEFELSEAGGEAIRTSDAGVIRSAMERVRGAYPEGQYAVFLTNHDMDRIMSQLRGDVARAKLVAAWMLTNPGVPFIYYGEEVGLQGVKPDERIRTPMPWTAEEPGLGFTAGVPWEPAFAGFEESNVAAQEDDPASLLNHYRALIQFRDASPALRYGEFLGVETGSNSVFAYLRSIDEDHVLVVGNLASRPVSRYALDLAVGPLAGMEGVIPIVGPAVTAPIISDRGGFLDYRPLPELPPSTALVLHFTDDPSPPPSTSTTTAAGTATDDDVLVVDRFWDATEGDDPEAWLSLMSPDAVASGEGGSIGLFDPLPVEAGAPDWDGDGIATIADTISIQIAWGVVTDGGGTAQVECSPDGRLVSCRVTGADLFYDAAGIQPSVSLQSFRVDDGMVVEVLAPDVEDEAQASFEAWLEQLAAYEGWVETEHSDEYRALFQGPCCAGGLDGAILTSDTVARHAELVREWAALDAG